MLVAFFKAIGKLTLNLLILVIVGITFLVSFFGSEDSENEMPPMAETFAPDNRGFAGSAPETGPLLPAPSRYDDQTWVEAANAQNWSSGTAFAIANNGLWLTAKHVARGCERLGILSEDRGSAVTAELVYLAPNADVAIIQTRGGPEPLSLDLDESDIKIGSQGFHVGYPQGKPGEVTSRLIGRELMITQGAWRGKENTLAWAETGRSRGLDGTLGGLSGGPAFDASGHVIGITVAESPRRGRIITTAASSVESALSVSGVAAEGTPQGPMTRSDFPRQAKRLRANLKVIQVICRSGN
jgi:S1-C subfamily serine protease